MYLETPKDKEAQLRVIRFFCYTLTPDDFACDTTEDREDIEENYSLKIDEINKKAEEEKSCALGKFKHKLEVYYRAIFISLVITVISIAATSSSEGIFWRTISTTITILSALVLIGTLIVAKNIHSEKSATLDKIESERKKQISDHACMQNRLLKALENKQEKLHNAWLDAKASKDEVLNYIQNIMSQINLQINSLLNISDNEIEDEQCADILGPTFFQTGSLPRSVSIDISRSKQDIYEMRDEIVEPLRIFFSDDLIWRTFKDSLFKKLNLHDKEKLRMSAYNIMRFHKYANTFLSGYYSYQKIFCTEDHITQFRCYVNTLGNRISFTQTLQIMYEDISAIGLETSQLAETFYDFSTVDKHVQSLSLELRSGSKYKMSGDAGSYIGNAIYPDAKSKANEIFKNQIRNVRAFVLEKKRRKGDV